MCYYYSLFFMRKNEKKNKISILTALIFWIFFTFNSILRPSTLPSPLELTLDPRYLFSTLDICIHSKQSPSLPRAPLRIALVSLFHGVLNSLGHLSKGVLSETSKRNVKIYSIFQFYFRALHYLLPFHYMQCV